MGCGIQYNTTQYNAIKSNIIHTIQYNTQIIQYNTIRFKAPGKGSGKVVEVVRERVEERLAEGVGARVGEMVEEEGSGGVGEGWGEGERGGAGEGINI